MSIPVLVVVRNIDEIVGVKNFYFPSDQIQYSATVTYFGFLDKDGKWYIQKQTVTGDNITWRYCKGNSGYAAAIANPYVLSYDYFDAIF